ncbi:MAG: hypothetical protein ABIK09_03075 [Pseudomonadota bacterium]
MGVWTFWLLFALIQAPGHLDGPGVGIVDSFGYRDLPGPDRLATVRTWVALRHGVGPDLLRCPVVDLVGVLMTGLVDTGAPEEDPALHRKVGLDLCEGMLPRLAPAELVPDPPGHLWADPEIVPTRLRDAAVTARRDLRTWCAARAAEDAPEDPCRAARIRLVTRPFADLSGSGGASALDDIRRHCGSRETSQLSLVVHALAGSDKDFERVRALMLTADLEAGPLLAAAVHHHESRMERRALAARWADARDMDAGLALLREAVGRRDRDAVRRLAEEAAGAGGVGRTLAVVALARVGLADEAGRIPVGDDATLRAHLHVFTSLQEALGQREPDRGAMDQALAALTDTNPGAARRVRFIYDAVARLTAAYASPKGVEEETARLSDAGMALLNQSEDPVLDLGVVTAQLYALEAWPALDRFLDHSLRVHPAGDNAAVAVAAARVLLLVGARLRDADRVQQAQSLLRHRLQTGGPSSRDGLAEARHLALAAEVYLGTLGGATPAVLEDLARRLQDLDEEAGEALTSSDRGVLRANLFSLTGTTAPSRRRQALAGLWREKPGRPLTLLLTALDRWYDGRYLEAALVLRLLSHTGCGGDLTASAVAWRDALRRRSGAAAPREDPSGSLGAGSFRIVVDGDLRTRILLGWDGRIAVEIHPADRLLFLPSPPCGAGTP